MPESYENMLTSLNVSFVILFCIEAVLKITAYGWVSLNFKKVFARLN